MTKRFVKSPVIKEVEDYIRLSYELCRPYFDRANKDVQIYDQIIDPTTWSTMSEMTLGLAYRLVQNTLPNLLLNVLWGSDNPFHLIPAGGSESINIDTADKIRKYLIYNLRDRMDIDTKGYATILDGVKLGVGYGIIEPKTVYMAERQMTVATNGEESASIAGLEVGEPKTIASYRYVPFGSVLNTMDGATPDDASATLFIDTANEHTLRALFEDDENPVEGNAEEIIKYAKNNGFDANTFNIRSIIGKLAGRTDMDFTKRYDGLRRQLKGVTNIPITKTYVQNRHIWLACNRFKIYESEKTVETLQCPILQYKFSPESDNWYSRGIISPNLDLMRSIETFENAMLDLFSIHLHPHQVVNIDALAEEDGAEDLQPYAKTYVRGAPAQAIAYTTPPVLPPVIASLGDRLQVKSDDLAGLNIPQGGQLSPGIVRGGQGALESLMASSTNREKVLAKHLENSWYKPLIQLTLVYSSLYASPEEEFTLVSTAETGNAEKVEVGKKFFNAIKVTRDELSHVWRVSINFREKLRNYLAESSHRLAVYQALADDPEINTNELKRYLIGDESLADRLTLGVDTQKRLADIEAKAVAQNGGAEEVVPPEAGNAGLLGAGGSGIPTTTGNVPEGATL